jgi:rhamnulokinase
MNIFIKSKNHTSENNDPDFSYLLESILHPESQRTLMGFAELADMAKETEKTAGYDWIVDVNLPRFFSPSSMIDELKDEYKRTGQRVPETPGELAYCVYTSLAQCYKIAIADLERITGKQYNSISIIGGGSRDNYLNALTARFTGKPVYAGPTEATATGNILLQMKQMGDIAVNNGFADLVKKSFNITEVRNV